MAVDQSAPLDLLVALKAAYGGDLMRQMMAMMLQELIALEATAVIGTGPRERSAVGATLRSGSREKLVTTGVGEMQG